MIDNELPNGSIWRKPTDDEVIEIIRRTVVAWVSGSYPERRELPVIMLGVMRSNPEAARVALAQACAHYIEQSDHLNGIGLILAALIDLSVQCLLWTGIRPKGDQ